MIIWNIEKLKRNLIEGKVSQKDFFLYFGIIFFVFTNCCLWVISFVYEKLDYSPLNCIADITDFLCLIACFRIHKYWKLKNFLENENLYI